MTPVDFELNLVPALDDLPVPSQDFQKELEGLNDRFKSANVCASPISVALCSAEAGGYQWTQYIVTIAPPVIAAVSAICGAWVQARYGRKVRIKIGDIEAEGRSVEEIEGLLKKVMAFRGSVPPKDEASP